MKKNYMSPFAEIVEFDTEEVLAPSDVTGKGDEVVDAGQTDNEEAGGKLDLGF